ncbi:MAG: hypothetical protein ACODAJ_01190 [Planctomycetota bacterium]
MSNEHENAQADDAVLSRLWDVAHKYRRCLKRGEVLPLTESEDDRQAVAPLGERLGTTTERNLDGITYRSLAEMQVRRDTRRLLSNLPGSVRLQRLGFEVAVRAKPVVFLHAPGELSPLGLLQSVNYEAERPAPDDETAAAMAELDDSEHRVQMHEVDERALEQMRGAVKERLVGRRFAAGELARSISSTEADLLSQLSRRGEVLIVVHAGGALEIRDGEAGRRTRTIAVALKPKRQGEDYG